MLRNIGAEPGKIVDSAIGNSGRDALYELILLRLLYRDNIGSSAPSLLALTYLGNLNYL